MMPTRVYVNWDPGGWDGGSRTGPLEQSPPYSSANREKHDRLPRGGVRVNGALIDPVTGRSFKSVKKQKKLRVAIVKFVGYIVLFAMILSPIWVTALLMMIFYDGSDDLSTRLEKNAVESELRQQQPSGGMGVVPNSGAFRSMPGLQKVGGFRIVP